jgi:hypothetical protein
MFRPLEALVTSLFLVAITVGQTQQPTLKPASQTRTPEPTPALKLEVRYNPETPPAYLDIRGPSEEPTWVWVTRFVRTPGNKVTAADLPVRAVKFETQFNGETTSVRVTVFRGNRGFEREDLVGLFKLGLGEHRLISELQSFQIEPIDITISGAPSPIPAQPTFELRTGAVEVVGTESEGSPMPAYRIKFRNVTEKKDQQMSMDSADAWVSAAQLRQQISNLKAVVPSELLSKKSSVSSSCTPPGLRIEASFNAMRLRLMRELDQIISTRPAPPVDFKQWLRTTRNSYASWLGRLTPEAAK